MASTLADQLQADLTAAMKARDEVRSSTLRMVLTAITNAEVAGKEARTLSDDEVMSVLSSEAKKRREAATAFTDGGRAEMAAKEEAEAAVIADYLPEPLTPAEIESIVAAAIEQTGAAGEGMKAMGNRLSQHPVKSVELVAAEEEIADETVEAGEADIDDGNDNADIQEDETNAAASPADESVKSPPESAGPAKEKPAESSSQPEQSQPKKIDFEITNPDDIEIDDKGQLGLF